MDKPRQYQDPVSVSVCYNAVSGSLALFCCGRSFPVKREDVANSILLVRQISLAPLPQQSVLAFSVSWLSSALDWIWGLGNMLAVMSSWLVCACWVGHIYQFINQRGIFHSGFSSIRLLWYMWQRYLLRAHHVYWMFLKGMYGQMLIRMVIFMTILKE